MHTTRFPHLRFVPLPLHLVPLAATAGADPSLHTVNPSNSFCHALRSRSSYEDQPIAALPKNMPLAVFEQFFAVFSTRLYSRKSGRGNRDLTKELRETKGLRRINGIVSLIQRVRNSCLHNLLTTLLNSILQEL